MILAKKKERDWDGTALLTSAAGLNEFELAFYSSYMPRTYVNTFNTMLSNCPCYLVFCPL